MIQTTIELAIIGVLGFISPGPIFPMLIDLSRGKNLKLPFALLLGMISLDLMVIIPSFILGNIFKDFFTVKVNAILSIIGGVFILYLGYCSFRSRESNVSKNQETKVAEVFSKGFLISIFSGSYWSWWTTVGFSYLAHYIHYGLQGFLIFCSVIFIPPMMILFAMVRFLTSVEGKSKRSLMFRRYFVTALYLIFGLRLIWEGGKFFLG